MAIVLQGLDSQLESFKGRLTLMAMIHAAMVAGVVLFGLVVLVLVRSKMTFVLALQNPMVIVAGVLAVSNVAGASVLHRIVFRFAGGPADVETALRKYQVFVLMRAAVIEGAALFCAVVTLITANVLPAILVLLCAGALAFYRPSQQEFVSLLRNAASSGSPLR
jgi:hypothetical protein